jgi:hypothetical protein
MAWPDALKLPVEFRRSLAVTKNAKIDGFD